MVNLLSELIIDLSVSNSCRPVTRPARFRLAGVSRSTSLTNLCVGRTATAVLSSGEEGMDPAHDDRQRCSRKEKMEGDSLVVPFGKRLDRHRGARGQSLLRAIAEQGSA